MCCAGCTEVSYKRDQSWPKYLDKWVSEQCVRVCLCFSALSRHKSISEHYTLHPACGSGGFLALCPQYEGALTTSSLDTLFQSCLNQRKRVAAALHLALHGQGPAGQASSGQREVRHLPSRTVPLTFSGATWRSRHWTSWEPQWWPGWHLPAGTQGHSQPGRWRRLRCRARGSRESWVLPFPRLEEQTLHGPPKATTGGASQAGPGPPQHKR